MFSKTEFFSILRLYASNRTLLQIYYSLYEKLCGEGAIEQREQLSSRIAMRERFRLQLMHCIDENFLQKEDSLLEKASIFTFPLLTQMETAIPNNLLADTWERCHEHEVKNLQKYYNTLYLPELEKNLSELLFEHKNCIEEYLHTYI